MMAKLVAALGAALLTLIVLPVPAHAASGDPALCNPCTVVGGTDGAVDVEVIRGTSEKVPGRGDASFGKAPGRTEWKTVEEYIAPACSANGLQGFEAMCMAALTCPADNLVRFWVWHRVTEWKLGPPPEENVGEWYQEPGSFCLGPDDPGIPDIGRVIAEVQSGFQSLPLPKFTPEINPAPSTLVNIPTKLAAGTADVEQFTTEPLAGIRVRVTATPTEWRWTFGDGSTAVTGVPRTTHVYEKAREFGASVRVTWTGTFQLLGTDEAFPIRTPAYVQGPVTPVDVRQARTELVRD